MPSYASTPSLSYVSSPSALHFLHASNNILIVPNPVFHRQLCRVSSPFRIITSIIRHFYFWCSLTAFTSRGYSHKNSFAFEKCLRKTITITSEIRMSFLQNFHTDPSPTSTNSASAEPYSSHLPLAVLLSLLFWCSGTLLLGHHPN